MAPRYDVREVQDCGHYWQVLYDVTLDDGTLTGHGHSIPKDTLEWRAAEYELHPVDDFETILDVVLSEPFIAEEDRLTGEELFDAPDIRTARVRHLNRCAKAKLKHRISTRKNGAAKAGNGGAPHPLDMIRKDCVMDELAIAVKHEHVRVERLGRSESQPEVQGSRVENLAVGLNVDLNAVRSEMRKSRG